MRAPDNPERCLDEAEQPASTEVPPILVSREVVRHDGVPLRQIRKTPLVLYGTFLELTRQLYSGNPDIGVPANWRWNQDVNKTKIWIDTEYEWEDTGSTIRPAIFISLSPIKYKPTAGMPRSMTYIDVQKAQYDYNRTGAGEVSWVHIGRTKGEGVKLLETTLDYMDAFSDVIRKDFGFDRFEVIAAQPTQVVKEEKERIRSTLTAHFEFQDTWTLKLESPKLKEITINAGRSILDVLQSEA